MKMKSVFTAAQKQSICNQSNWCIFTKFTKSLHDIKIVFYLIFNKSNYLQTYSVYNFNIQKDFLWELISFLLHKLLTHPYLWTKLNKNSFFYFNSVLGYFPFVTKPEIVF